METGDGYRVIGSVIGANNWEKNCRKIIKTAEIAVEKAGPWPLNIYLSFTSSVQQKLTFLARTTILQTF